uniref:VWFC domain-containing protein n=1 Tax=Hucho hucho TaxID=62062 RepID=A0A4W5QNI0_9TELE
SFAGIVRCGLITESCDWSVSECDPHACPPVTTPDCREDQFLVEVREDNSCCYSFLCVCESCIEPVPACSDGEILAVNLSTTNSCCPQYHCVCDVNLCPESSLTCSPGLSLVQTTHPGHCCPDHRCGTHTHTNTHFCTHNSCTHTSKCTHIPSC